MFGLFVKEEDPIKRFLAQTLSCVKLTEDNVNCDVAFVDLRLESALEAVKILENLTQNKIPTIIFDREFALTEEERSLLSGVKNVILTEPAINYRRDFIYIPHWIERIDPELREESREYSIGYIGDVSDKLSEFEDLVVSYAKAYPKFKVGCNIKVPSGIDISRFEEHINFDDSLTYELFEFTIVLGSRRDYRNGILPDIDPILKRTCVPLLSASHRYFYPIFKNMIIYNLQDIIYYTNNPKLVWAFQSEIYENISIFFPEMLVENVSNLLRKIYNQFGGK